MHRKYLSGYKQKNFFCAQKRHSTHTIEKFDLIKISTSIYQNNNK